MKVLIADDSAMIRERIINILAGTWTDIEVSEADNGLDAIRVIRKLNPDLVFLDIRMPEMNGIDVLKKIKEMHLRTEICILTSYPFPQYRKKCLDLGADYFLNKNQEFEKIPEIILMADHSE